LASAVTKAKRLNQWGAKQREVRAGFVLLLGLQVPVALYWFAAAGCSVSSTTVGL